MATKPANKNTLYLTLSPEEEVLKGRFRNRLSNKHYAPGELCQHYIKQIQLHADDTFEPTDFTENTAYAAKNLPENTPEDKATVAVYNKDKIVWASRQASPQYKSSLNQTRLNHLNDFSQISNYYGGLADGNTSCSIFSRLRHGNFYQGHIEKTRLNSLFIDVIDRLTLINKDYTHALKDQLQQQLTDNTFSQMTLLLGEQLAAIQTYYKNYIEAIIDLFCDQDEILKTYLNKLLNGGTESDEDIAKISVKKRFNIKRELYKIQKIEKESERQTGLLAGSINRLSEELCVDYKIKKTNEDKGNSLNFSMEYETFIASEREKKDRKIKRNCKRASKVTAVFVGIGEGFVAAVGIAAFISISWLGILAAIVIGGCGFICNAYLVKDDSDDTLQEIFLGKGWGYFSKKIFQDENGNEVGKFKKFCLMVALTLALGAGCAYGFLSASAIAGILGLTGGAAIAIVIFPVLFTAIGLASMLYVVLSDIIKNERWKDIKTYFKNEFYCQELWQSMSPSEKVKHVFISCPFKALRLIVGLALCVFITIASLGVFYNKGLGLLKSVTRANIASNISKAIAYSNAIVIGTFSIKKINGGINEITLADTLCFVPNIVNYALFISGSTAEAAIRTAINFIAAPFIGLYNLFKSPENKINRAVDYTPNLTAKFCSAISKIFRACANYIAELRPIKYLRNILSKPTADYKKINNTLLENAAKIAAQKSKPKSTTTPAPQQKGNQTNHVQKANKKYNDMLKMTASASVIANGIGQTCLFTGSASARSTLHQNIGGATDGIANACSISPELATSIAIGASEAAYSSLPNAAAAEATQRRGAVIPINNTLPSAITQSSLFQPEKSESVDNVIEETKPKQANT